MNFSKSRVFGISVDTNEVVSIALILNCQSASLPFTYLGLPMGANMSLCKNWKLVIDQFQFRLSTWKAKTLSFRGRTTLVNSVLSSLLIFYFSLSKAPLKVIKNLDGFRRKFLWAGGSPTTKICWITWDKVLTPKNKGCMGVVRLRASNYQEYGKTL